MTTRAPSLFVSHGSPMMPFEPGPAREALRALGTQYRPRAILCVSAHWETAQPVLGGATQPGTIHDFYNFPPQLYEQRYAAPGDPALAAQARGLLREAGFEAMVDGARGLDHGAWVPLMLMYPQAAIPVVQLSVQPSLDAAHHLRLGRALRGLRDEGVMMLASGGATHNLRDLRMPPDDDPPAAYAAGFDDWLATAVEAGDADALTAYLTQAPEARHNHPTPEHYLPLPVALGAAHAPRGRVLHRSFVFGTLSMSSFVWD
ncbi:DODA-type extradiol aromatic ring-opening family dioxygenase [Acidihalobacter prosperus]|nr:class III extradiol ring-cleavage dioxygenase [Acidihalobacter prosperus]